MSLEPKKPIEELLEASAKIRRAEFGAEPKMPNPTRTQLHDEIARLARKEESEKRPHTLAMLWPRLVIGTALAAFVIGVPATWWWRERQTAGGESIKLAMQSPMAAKDANEVFKEGAAAGAAPAQSFADNNASPTQSVETAKASDSLRKFAEVQITPPTTVPMTKGFITADKKTDEARLFDNSAKESNKAAPAVASLARSRQLMNFRQQSSQNPAKQVLRDNSKLKQAINILNEFQVEQEGPQIRLVDTDGSTYSGKLEALAQNDSRSVFNQKQNYAASSSRAVTSPSGQTESGNAEFYFRATGYNSTLKKPLVFEGNYIASAPVQKKAGEAEQRGEQTQARIVGTAKIGGETSVPIDAVSVAQ